VNKAIWLPVVCAIGGIGAGIVIAKYTLPPRIEERVVTKVEVREVEKWKDRVVVEKGPERVTTRTVTTPGPQGPTVTVEKIVEKEKIVTVRDSSGTRDTARTDESEKVRIEDSRAWFALEGGAGIGLSTGAIAWNAGAQFRVFGLAWAGAQVIKADQVYIGPSVRFEF
jgi:hypothetical protein